jgi:hypothetical protein
VKYLSECEENCLQFLLNRKDNIGFGNDDEVSLEDISGENFTFAHFQTLEKEGYIIGNIFTDTIYYYLTSKAIDYFPEKNKRIEMERKEKSVVTRRYWLDKIIPFLALLVSVIALLNSIFKWWQV